MEIIKFEGEHSDLKDLHQFLFSKDNTIDLDEEYKSTPGINKAPDVISIIITLSTIATPVFKLWIKEYYNLKREKLKHLKISQKKHGEFKEIRTVDEIDEKSE